MKIKLFDSDADDAKCVLSMNDPNDAIEGKVIIEHNGMHYIYAGMNAGALAFVRTAVIKLPNVEGEVSIGG
jgi:hypothetical protein